MADNLDSSEHRKAYEGFVRLTNLSLVAIVLVLIGMTIALLGGSTSLGVLIIVVGVLGTAAYGLLSE